MRIIAVIPARFGAMRFPGKPLVRETGKFLIQHVYEGVVGCARIDQVIVATDDERIASAVRSFGGEVRMTRSDHTSGTDRVAEVAGALECRGDDVVINVQGDEPEVTGNVLLKVIDALESGGCDCSIATPATPFDDAGPRTGPGSPLDPNCVKVVLDERGRALYFSRSPIPFPRDAGGAVDRPSRWLLHMGVYAFRAETLHKIVHDTRPRPSTLERAESLEQLRWLERGLSIAVAVVDHRFVGVDTPDDYAAFVRRYQKRHERASQPSLETRTSLV